LKAFCEKTVVFYKKKAYKNPSNKKLKGTEIKTNKKLSVPKVHKNKHPISQSTSEKQFPDVVAEGQENSENKLLKDRDYGDLEI